MHEKSLDRVWNKKKWLGGAIKQTEKTCVEIERFNVFNMQRDKNYKEQPHLK